METVSKETKKKIFKYSMTESKIYIFRNFFVENIIKDLEFSKKIKKKEFVLSDYSSTFNAELITNENLNIFFIDFTKIRNLDKFIKRLEIDIKKFNRYKIKYFYFYYNTKNLKFTKHTLNLKNICNLNTNKQLIKKGILFDTHSYSFLTNYLEILISIYDQNIIRSFVFDLDNTLWTGILGEDRKVSFNKFQKKNINLINNLIKKGFIISLISKNNLSDVKKFMMSPKLKNIFKYSKKYISWNEKTQSLTDLVEWSKINQKNFLFFDDNHNEIFKVKKNFKFMCTFNAQNSELVGHLLDFVVSNSESGSSAKLRQNDLKNNELRENIKAPSIINYVKQIRPQMHIYKNSKKQLNRIVEMSNKINQFNLSDQRFNKDDIISFLQSNLMDLFTFSLKDNYGDSGIVGYCLIKKTNKILVIDDIKISCRALGRYMEIYFLNNIILMYKNNFEKITFNYKKTNINKPVKLFLHKHFNLSKLKLIKNIKELDYFKYVKKRFN